MNNQTLANAVYNFYLGEIREDELFDIFLEWAKENKYPLPKMIKLLKNMAFNSIGEVVPLVSEDENSIYYNDSCHRYCYLNKSDEGIDFEYVSVKKG